MPSLIWCKAISGDADLGSHNRLELIVCDFQESQEFADEHSDIALVDQRETEIESSSPDTDIGVPQTIQDGVTMSLDGIWLHSNDFNQRIQSDVSDIVVAVRQELSENVNAENA